MTKDEMVLKVMHLAYLVHQRTDYCVWIRFSGHVDSLGITIAESKKNWRNEVLEDDVYTAYKAARDDGLDPCLASLQSKITVLERILEDGEIPYDELDYEEIVERSYRF